MKYPLFILPNQTPDVVVVQGTRQTFERLIQDFGKNLLHRRIMNPVQDQFRQQDSNIIKVRLSRSVAHELLSLVGLSY